MRRTTEAAYSEFARAAWPHLYRTAVLIVGDRQLAEDLVQSALVKTYLAWPRLREPDKARAYTRRVMVTVSRDWFRKHAWNHEDVRDVDESVGGAADHTADLAGDLADRVTLADALRALPLGQRSVLVLRFLEDLSVQETADLLNVSTGTVKSQTVVALAALRARADLVTEGAHDD